MKRIIIIALFLGSVLPALAQEKPRLYTIASPFERYTHYLATNAAKCTAKATAFRVLYQDEEGQYCTSN